MNNTVVLFDIDWTLIKGTGPFYIEAHRVALKQVLGVDLEQDFNITPHEGKVGIQFVRDLAIERGIDPQIASDKAGEVINATDDYLAKYSDKLEITEISGARKALEEFKKRGLLLGVLTGNSRRTAELKLKKAGLYEYFSLGAYGNETFNRVELVDIAKRRAEEIIGSQITKDNIFLIGDNLRDVSCGKEGGVKTIAVASGPVNYDTLIESSADLVLHSLSEIDKLVEFIEESGKINAEYEK